MVNRSTAGKHAFGRSLGDFPNMSNAEKTLIEKCRLGEPAICTNGKRPTARTPDNAIRPELIRFLVLGGDDEAPVHEKGVQIRGAWIDKDLDLSGCIHLIIFGLINCRIDGDLWLRDAALQVCNLDGSHIKDLHGNGVKTVGSLFLRYGFKATGKVSLLGAQFGGVLSCRGGEFAPMEGEALVCDSMTVRDHVYFDGGFKATGPVRLLGARIGGNLECSKGEFLPKEGNALCCDRVNVEGSVFLADGFKAAGKVKLADAQIGGNFSCAKGEFTPKEGTALSCDRVNVKGSVFLDNSFKAKGKVRMQGAQIGGDLVYSKGEFAPEENNALICDRANVKGTVFLGDGFKATGKVRLLGAQIGGDLVCSDGEFIPKRGVALYCDLVDVKGNLFLNKGFNAAGNVRLPQARIGGVIFIGGQFDGPVGLAGAKAAALYDDISRWPKNTILDGFCYERIAAGAPTDAASRIAWLKKQSSADLNKDFKPQPWEQLVKVLREMGHENDAKTVAMAKQDALRAAGKIGGFAKPLHWLYGRLAGYGYRPRFGPSRGWRSFG